MIGIGGNSPQSDDDRASIDASDSRTLHRPVRASKKRSLVTTSAALGFLSLLVISGCTVGHANHDLVNGKKEFIANCGSCHVLKRAGTTGVTGPNLDEAFQRSIQDGIGRSSIEGMVHGQILYPSSKPSRDPVTGKPLPVMPPGGSSRNVKGGTAWDVAAYVAEVAAKPGQDAGLLAQVGQKTNKGIAKENNGTLTIPADPSGSLNYIYASAVATAGQVEVKSPNKSSVQHDIAIKGNGVMEKGQIVSNGGVSSFSANLKPGKYLFYCTVDGHEQAGMKGTLTVK
jgi:plastocyanin